MCGRYSLEARPDEIAEAFDLAEAFLFEARYNIAPTQRVPVVRVDEGSGSRRVATIRWGLTSHPGNPRPLINARSETVARKPSFRKSFRSRRCLVPATGFFEWQKLGGAKQPFHIQRADRGLFAFAGIWDEALLGDGSHVEAFAVLTTEPNRIMRPIHDRMPVLLARESWATWLESDTPQQYSALLVPAPDEILTAIPVGNRVNSPANDDPACIEPLLRQTGGFSEQLFD
jgi:putative SOS response-associated peptidase YedK